MKTICLPPMVLAFWMPAAMVSTGAACVPGLVGLPMFDDTNVPIPPQFSSTIELQLLSRLSPQYSTLVLKLLGSESSQSPAQVVSPSWSASGQAASGCPPSAGKAPPTPDVPPAPATDAPAAPPEPSFEAPPLDGPLPEAPPPEGPAPPAAPD